MKLYKSTIVIWSEFDPTKVELSHLAREAESGEAYCAKCQEELIQDAEKDPDWDGTDFFGEEDEAPPETEEDQKHAAWEAERGAVWEDTGV